MDSVEDMFLNSGLHDDISNKACECYTYKRVIAVRETGFSDSAFRTVQCSTCKKVFTEYLEG